MSFIWTKNGSGLTRRLRVLTQDEGSDGIVLDNSRQHAHAFYTMQDDDDSSIDSGAVSPRDWGRRNTAVPSLAVFTSMNILTATLTNPSPAMASGRVTPGGCYPLSAKQRYNARVTAGIKSLFSLEHSLSSGSLDDTMTFFTSDEDDERFGCCGVFISQRISEKYSTGKLTICE